MRTARTAIGAALAASLLALPATGAAAAADAVVEFGPQIVLPAVEEPTPVPGPRGDAGDDAAPPVPRAAEEGDAGAGDAGRERSGGAVATAASEHAVAISDFLFDPETIEVSAGDTITWTNDDEAPHDATADDGSFATKLLDEGESDSVTFEEEGTFSYICSIHPPDGGYEDFVGTVKVVASSADDGGAGGGGGGTDAGATPSTTDPGIDSFGTTPSSGPGSSSAASRSDGSLPETGLDAIALLLIGAGLLSAGLLVRAVVEHLAWR